MNAWEREAVRQAVKEASSRSKEWRESRSVGTKGTPATGPLQGELRDVAVRVEGDANDIFVEILQAALRRAGAWIVFLE